MLIVTVNVLRLAKEDALVLVSALLTCLIKLIGTEILTVYISAKSGKYPSAFYFLSKAEVY